jgi:hypothetical protein
VSSARDQKRERHCDGEAKHWTPDSHSHPRAMFAQVPLRNYAAWEDVAGTLR